MIVAGKKQRIFLIVTIALIVILAIINFNIKNHRINGDIEMWLTTSDQKHLLSKMPDIKASNLNIDPSAKVAIYVNPNKTYQQIDGFGASFTDASSWLIWNTLDEKSREELMLSLFSYDKGIGLSFLRQPMGATDYSLNLYTYDDMPQGEQDFDLKNFTIAHDEKYIIPLLQQAKKINPELKIMASPWSPPAWMKTSDSLIGGMLRPECYNVYSQYFIKFIKAYEEHGIPIFAVTPQNEPLYVPTEYPGMSMQPYEEAKFIAEFLGPSLQKSGLNTKIMCYDHNWDNPAYPEIVIKEADNYVAGTAWHAYGGSHEAMSILHNKFPDKGSWLTEASGGEWVPPFYDAFADQMTHIIRGTRNYAKSIVWWNIALDQNNGPTVLKNSTCRGLVTINTDNKFIKYNVDYYTMGHISKFVKPGAFRIESTNIFNDIETAAFKNPDGSIVLIAYNKLPKDRLLNIKYENSNFECSLPGKAAASFVWNE